jgi:LytS/YehU family sensor histidine kinase
MNSKQSETVKLAVEIGSLSAQLTVANQHYVLNTINTLLYSQQIKEEPEKKTRTA